MSKAEILAELPKLGLEDRREIFERICEMEESDLLKGGRPSAEEKQLVTGGGGIPAKIPKPVRLGMKWKPGCAKPSAIVSWLVIVRPNAEADLQKARSWYESRAQPWAVNFWMKFAARFNVLESDSELPSVLLPATFAGCSRPVFTTSFSTA